MHERVGEVFVSNEGCKFVIVEYNGCEDLWIEFEDEYKARVHTNYGNCKRGSIKNPYFPSVFNHGYLGLMSDGSKPIASVNRKMTREYYLWNHMLQRCYSSTYHEKQSTYENVIVCNRWLCFANFLEDLPKIENYELWLNNDGYALDKDIKQQGVKNKVYALETVCFVTQSENSKERIERRGNPRVKS